MKSMQYTIRTIPPVVDKALRKRAQETGQSLNEVVLDALAIGTGIKPDYKYDDLDWFVGSKLLGKSFDDNQEWLNSLPQDIS